MAGGAQQCPCPRNKDENKRESDGARECMQQPFTMPELQLKEFSSVLVD